MMKFLGKFIFFFGYGVDKVIAEDLVRMIKNNFIQGAELITTQKGDFYNFGFPGYTDYDMWLNNVKRFFQDAGSPLHNNTEKYLRDHKKNQEDQTRLITEMAEWFFQHNPEFIQWDSEKHWRPGPLMLDLNEFSDIVSILEGELMTEIIPFKRSVSTFISDDNNRVYSFSRFLLRSWGKEQRCLYNNRNDNVSFLLYSFFYITKNKRLNMRTEDEEEYKKYITSKEKIFKPTILLEKRFHDDNQQEYSILLRKDYVKFIGLISKLREKKALSWESVCVQNAIKKVNVEIVLQGEECNVTEKPSFLTINDIENNKDLTIEMNIEILDHKTIKLKQYEYKVEKLEEKNMILKTLKERENTQNSIQHFLEGRKWYKKPYLAARAFCGERNQSPNFFLIKLSIILLTKIACVNTFFSMLMIAILSVILFKL